MEGGELPMTKDETFKRKVKVLELDYDAVDFALPQQWVDEMVVKVRRIGRGQFEDAHSRVCAQFVWLYDKKAPMFGRPFPLTEDAEGILAKFL